jgi:hypothetical protein
MAVGDVVADIQSIAAAAYLDIQPSAGVEWVIHNIYHEHDIELSKYDGTNSLAFDTETGPGIHAKYAFHCNNMDRVRVKNTNVSARLIGYDGVQTK